MGTKYEFTDETMKYEGHLLHRIKRLSDGKLGGWIEKEDNLSQDGNCWVDDNAIVCDNAIVSGNAKVYGDAIVCENAHIYGSAEVYGHARTHVYYSKIYGNAQVFGYAKVDGAAQVYDDGQVYDHAHVYGHAEVYGNAKVYGDTEFYSNTSINEDISSNDSPKEVVQDFIYKVNDSNKLTTQTEYDSINEFFSSTITNDVKLDTLVICAIDTKEPLIKLQKVNTDNKTEFKFIVDITNEDGDNFMFKSIIKSQEQLNQLIQQTIEALKLYPKFSKYVDDLENCL